MEFLKIKRNHWEETAIIKPSKMLSRNSRGNSIIRKMDDLEVSPTMKSLTLKTNHSSLLRLYTHLVFAGTL